MMPVDEAAGSHSLESYGYKNNMESI